MGFFGLILTRQSRIAHSKCASAQFGLGSMKLTIQPDPKLDIFRDNLELAICVRENQTPEILIEEGLPRPDRHLLLGIVQAITIAAEENDEEMLEVSDNCTVAVHFAGEKKFAEQVLVIVRSQNGRFAAFFNGDRRTAKSFAKKALRWFTGTIRLDIP